MYRKSQKLTQISFYKILGLLSRGLRDHDLSDFNFLFIHRYWLFLSKFDYINKFNIYTRSFNIRDLSFLL